MAPGFQRGWIAGPGEFSADVRMTKMASQRPTTIAEYIQTAPSVGQAHLRQIYAILKKAASSA